MLHRSIRRFALGAALLLTSLGALAPRVTHADIGAAATSEQSTYARGQTNTFVFHLALSSRAFETADNIHFAFPAGIAVSAARYVEGNDTCPDALLLVLGMGTNDGGWFNPGHPSGCGFFSTSSAGEPQTFSIDADIPAGYIGDLPVLISVEGDQCCGSPPHEDSVTLTFADAASAAAWNFDDVVAPALPAGWDTAASRGAVSWITVADVAATEPNAAHAPAPAQSGDTVLDSPLIAVDPAGGELRFRHRFEMTPGGDGGVIEIAIGNGAFKDIVSAGGVFRQGAYNGQVAASAGCSGGNANPLVGRDAWSGSQDAFSTVAITLPDKASGHQARFRWRLGTDCNGPAPAANGWWIDDVIVVPGAPLAAIGPDKMAVSLAAGTQTIETIDIRNIGGGLLDYSVATADADCSNPTTVEWLQLLDDHGASAGGESSAVRVSVDGSALAAGKHAAFLCVATTDATHPALAIPVSLLVADACVPGDRLFADGFEVSAQSIRAADAPCTSSLRTFTRRDAFLAATADGYAEDRYTGLRSGFLHGPIEFGNGTYTYSVFTQDNPLNRSLFLFPGSGVLSTASSGDQVTLTFTGAPVTALGGNFMGALFSLNQRPLVASATIVLTLDDGSSETFTASSLDNFRGFISSKPILGLSIASVNTDPNSDIPWGVVDNIIVGRASPAPAAQKR